MNTRLDDRIKAALESPDAPAGADEASIFQLIGDVMLGRQRWLNAFSMFITLLMFGLGIFCLVRMLQTADARTAVLWAVGVIWCALAVAMLKIWFWMQLDKYALVREIKRLEVQIARLVEARSR